MNDQQNQRPVGNSQLLYVTLILDESGSMQSCKGAALAGFNQYLAALRKEPAETRLTLTLFHAGKTEVRYRGVPVSAAQDLDVETYRPQDGTPLYDAIGRTLSLAKREVPAGAKKFCIILTDGLENSGIHQETGVRSRAANAKDGHFCIWEPITTCGPPVEISESRVRAASRSVAERSITPLINWVTRPHVSAVTKGRQLMHSDPKKRLRLTNHLLANRTSPPG